MRALKRLLGRKGSSVEVSESRGVRTLHLGGEAIQSAMRLSAPDRLELAYTRAMMAFLLFAPAPRDILMVGLGGGSIARFVYERLPRTRITGVIPRRPQVRDRGGLSDWPHSSSKTIQPPRAAAVLLSAARSPSSTPGPRLPLQATASVHT